MRRVVIAIFALLVVAAIFVLVAVHQVFRTVPPRNETREVEGLETAATLTTDSLGVPVLRAESVNDLAFLGGWAHARDRRFQMEMQRRSASGRLSEVVGRATLAADRRMRTFGFAAVAESAAARLGSERYALFAAYAAGVNAYDRSHPPPLECSLLGMKLEPWRIQDCLLTVLLMFEQLQDDGGSERMVERMDQVLPASLVEFLMPESTAIDVPLAGGPARANAPIPTQTS
jgi:penicillin amidase